LTLDSVRFPLLSPEGSGTRLARFEEYAFGGAK
jgi:hypothetical protein